MMTIEDMARLNGLPVDPDQAGFDQAVMDAGASLALVAADHRGVRSALIEAVQLIIAGCAMETDRPRVTVDMLVEEIRAGSCQLLELIGQGRCDA